jgi:hypothetical protein
MKKIAMLCCSALILVSCHNTASSKQETHENSEYQEKLMRDGWTFEDLSDSELGEEYGVKPIYGIQDNYFDITMGEGYNVAVKIVDAQTDRCIRYAVVKENSTTTVTQIPQGKYYLKLAYGNDWMELETDSITIGKFTRNAFYEKSRETYNFGKKNSMQEVNYDLRINVREKTGMNNFETSPISEEEFLK